MKMKTQYIKIYEMQQKQFQKGNLQYTDLPQETRKISNKQSKLTSKGTLKRTNKTQISRKREIIKIRTETHEIKTKNKINGQ